MGPIKSSNPSAACEVCGKKYPGSTTLGLKTGFGAARAMPLCRSCGAVELDLMQLCREATIG